MVYNLEAFPLKHWFLTFWEPGTSFVEDKNQGLSGGYGSNGNTSDEPVLVYGPAPCIKGKYRHSHYH